MRRRRRKNFTEEDEFGIGDSNALIGFEEKKKNYILEKDFFSLEKLLQELFTEIERLINRRNFNKQVVEICQKSLILFEELKQRQHHISVSTFESISFLQNIYELEEIADEVGEEIENDDDIVVRKKEEELENIEEIISFLIKIFNTFAQLYPKNISIPDDEVLDFILTIENDWDFELLLIGLAKTKDPRVYKFLKDFEVDAEKEVRDLAKMLLNDLAPQFSISNKAILKDLIAEDELAKTLKILLDFGKSKKDIELTNEVYYQLGRHSRLEKDVRLGTISFQDSNLTRNQIRFSIIELIEKV